MKSLLFAVVLVSSLVGAASQSWACIWPFCPDPDAVRKTVHQALSEKGRDESRLVSYSVKHNAKVRSKTESEKSSDDSFWKRVGDGISDGLYGTSYEAIIISDVHLGVDLSKIKPGDIVVDGDVVTITLPEVEVIATELNLEGSGFTEADEGLLVSNKDTRDSIRKIFSDHKNSAEKEVMANEDNIRRARESAKKAILSILKIATETEDLDVNFSDPTS